MKCLIWMVFWGFQMTPRIWGCLFPKQSLKINRGYRNFKERQWCLKPGVLPQQRCPALPPLLHRLRIHHQVHSILLCRLCLRLLHLAQVHLSHPFASCSTFDAILPPLLPSLPSVLPLVPFSLESSPTFLPLTLPVLSHFRLIWWES